MISSLEAVDWHGFLARSPLPAPSPETVSSLIQQPILITGAGGSIGSASALRLASAGVQTILLESSESNLRDLQFEFASLTRSPRAAFQVGSVADGALLVPDYSPSSAVLAPRSTVPSQVSDE